MTKRYLMTVGTLIVLGLSEASAGDAADRPNLLFILIDDLGWRDLGCTGSNYYQTPNIDRLASEGMRFTRAYSNCMVCSPSRASILTGQSPARHKMSQVIIGPPHAEPRFFEYLDRKHHPANEAPQQLAKHNIQMRPARALRMLRPEQVCFPQVLRDAGYRTGLFGKWHVGYHPNGQPTAFGFEEACGFRLDVPPPKTSSHTINQTHREVCAGFAEAPLGKRFTAELADRAIAFIRAHADEPFLVWFSPFLVHTPLDGRPDLVAKYEKVPGDDQRDPHYAAMVEEVDLEVGRLLAALDHLSLTKNTAVVFFSDNGGYSPKSTSNLPLLGGKSYGYEAGTRVPLVVKWPGHTKPGALCETPVIGADLYPTFLAMAGLPLKPEQHRDGVSLKGLLTGESELAPRALFWHYPHYTHATGPVTYMIDEADWKLIRYWNEYSGAYELYDLGSDPNETTDVAARFPERVRKMAERLQARLAETGAELPRPRDAYDPGKPSRYHLEVTKSRAEGERARLRKNRRDPNPSTPNAKPSS